MLVYRKRTRNLVTLFLLLSLTSMGFAACSSKEGPKKRHFFDEMTPKDSYTKTFRSSTKEEKVYSEFEPVLTAKVTYWNTRLRESYVKERASRYRLTPDEAKVLAEEELREDEAFHVFILSAFTREMEWNDFDKARSLWRITLENKDGSQRLVPERVEVISEKDEVSKYFYQTMDRFGRTYKLRFPKAGLGDIPTLHLHIAGPRGDVSFQFKVEAPRNAEGDPVDEGN